MASAVSKSKSLARVALVSWAALAVATGACGGGSSSSQDGSSNADGGGLFPTACPKQTVPAAAQPFVISDFSMPGSDGKGVSWGYGSPEAFSGYSFQYPDAIVPDFTAGTWHLAGTVNNYAGFALTFTCAVDASKYTGISFSIKGDAGATGRLIMSVGTSPDDINKASGAPSFGKCVPKTGEYDGTCQSPRFDVPVTATVNTIKVKWADLKGGAPQASVSSDSLSGIVWIWDWITGATPFPTDITVDDVVFTID